MKVDLTELTARANKGLDTGLTNEQLKEVVACLQALKEVRDTARLISSTGRTRSVKVGTSLIATPLHYEVPLYVVNTINNLMGETNEN